MHYLAVLLACSSAVDPAEDCHLMSGTLLSANGEYEVFVAIDGDRGVSGVANQSGVGFTWINGSSRIASINFGPATSVGKYLWEGREFHTIALEKPLPDGRGFVLSDALMTPRLALVSSSLLFRQPYLGIKRFKISELQSVQNEFGKLKVGRDASGALESMEFSQESGDRVSPALDHTLAEMKRPFESGCRSTQYHCRFSPPLTESLVSWTAECRRDRVSMKGELRTRTDVLNVKHFSRDPVEVRDALSMFVEQIPKNERVSTYPNEPISYVWRDGKVVRNLGESAVAVAAEAEFQGSTNRRWLWLLLVVSAIAGIAIFWIRKQPRGEA